MNYEVNAYWSAAGLYRMIIEFKTRKRIMLSELPNSLFVVQLYITPKGSHFEESISNATFTKYHMAIAYINAIMVDGTILQKECYN